MSMKVWVALSLLDDYQLERMPVIWIEVADASPMKQINVREIRRCSSQPHSAGQPTRPAHNRTYNSAAFD